MCLATLAMLGTHLSSTLKRNLLRKTAITTTTTEEIVLLNSVVLGGFIRVMTPIPMASMGPTGLQKELTGRLGKAITTPSSIFSSRYVAAENDSIFVNFTPHVHTHTSTDISVISIYAVVSMYTNFWFVEAVDFVLLVVLCASQCL